MTLPVRVEAVRQVFNDGNHNAFTDLCWFGDHIYLTFRSCPDGHMLFTSSRIIVMRSKDGQAWEQVFAFSVPDRDVRDPHFLVFAGKLFVYSGAWLVNPQDPRDTYMNDHLGFAVWSEDGKSWHGPRLLEGTHGYYIWRAGTYGNTAYLLGRRVRNFAKIADSTVEARQTEAWLLGSADGINWLPTGLIQPERGNETAFIFDADGSVLAVARTLGREPAELCRAKPPYTEWTRSELTRYVGGPMLARWGDRYLVGGRKMIDNSAPVTALYWLVNDQLEEIAELPSGGDTSYPGFVPFDATHGLLSYYSSHEGSGTSLAPSAIYLADLRLG